jgi:hypothetical protein
MHLLTQSRSLKYKLVSCGFPREALPFDHTVVSHLLQFEFDARR